MAQIPLSTTSRDLFSQLDDATVEGDANAHWINRCQICQILPWRLSGICYPILCYTLFINPYLIFSYSGTKVNLCCGVLQSYLHQHILSLAKSVRVNRLTAGVTNEWMLGQDIAIYYTDSEYIYIIMQSRVKQLISDHVVWGDNLSPEQWTPLIPSQSSLFDPLLYTQRCLTFLLWCCQPHGSKILIRPACLQKFRRPQYKGPQYIWQVTEADISLRGAATGHNHAFAEWYYLELQSGLLPCHFWWIIYQSSCSILLLQWQQHEYFNFFLQFREIVSFRFHKMSTWRHNCFPALWFQTATVKKNWTTHRVKINCYLSG